MSKKKTHDEVLKERVEDVEILFAYFNVTRTIQYYIQRDGSSQFILNSFDTDSRFWSAWKNKQIPPTTKNKVMAGRIRTAFNKIHNIPSSLLKEVIGKHGDKHIHQEEVLSKISGYKFVKSGQKRYKGKLVDSWCHKWVMKDKVLLRQLLCDPNYQQIDTMPAASERIKRIIKKWEAKNELQN